MFNRIIIYYFSVKEQRNMAAFNARVTPKNHDQYFGICLATQTANQEEYLDLEEYIDEEQGKIFLFYTSCDKRNLQLHLNTEATCFFIFIHFCNCVLRRHLLHFGLRKKA